MKWKETARENRGFYKKLFALALPIAMQNLLSAIVSASDALMLGLQSQAALSAVSLATQVQFVLNLFLAALTIGETVLAAQYWGKNDTESVEQILAISLRISILAVFGKLALASAVPLLPTATTWATIGSMLTTRMAPTR